MPHRHDFCVLIVSAHQGYPRWINSGADFIEVDVRRSADGALVVSHDEPKRGSKRPTLDEVLDAAAGRVGVQLDLKEVGDELEVVQAAVEKCDRLAVTSPFYESIRAVKDRFPEVTVGLTRQYVEQTDADFIALDQRHATDEALDFCAARALPVWVWTVDERKLMERFVHDQRVAGLITNRPDLALRLRTERS
jgi:glycerophosphoryl diester phosphodiesterase